jgi:hypothetical protein
MAMKGTASTRRQGLTVRFAHLFGPAIEKRQLALLPITAPAKPVSAAAPPRVATPAAKNSLMGMLRASRIYARPIIERHDDHSERVDNGAQVLGCRFAITDSWLSAMRSVNPARDNPFAIAAAFQIPESVRIAQLTGHWSHAAIADSWALAMAPYAARSFSSNRS